jgi:hypothetical protein
MFTLHLYLIGFIFIIIFVYAVLKEREELGCYRLSIGRQCIDEESVYVKNTKAEQGDTCKDLYERMGSILSYHEKAGVWRRCIIMAIIITFFVYIVYNINKNFNINQYIVLLLVSFSLIYFYHNFINYHHFRRLKQNGIEILQLMKQKCK